MVSAQPTRTALSLGESWAHCVALALTFWPCCPGGPVIWGAEPPREAPGIWPPSTQNAPGRSAWGRRPGQPLSPLGAEDGVFLDVPGRLALLQGLGPPSGRCWNDGGRSLNGWKVAGTRSPASPHRSLHPSPNLFMGRGFLAKVGRGLVVSPELKANRWVSRTPLSSSFWVPLFGAARCLSLGRPGRGVH